MTCLIKPAWFRTAARAIVAGALLAAGVAAAAPPPPLPAFTAHYRLLRNGSPIGKATLTLAAGANGTWTFTTQSEGTSGLASLLAAGTREVSVFRWVGDLPQGESYTYAMHTRIKQRHRKVQFDWAAHRITVVDDGTHTFATRPGAMERHTVPLALAAGLAAGQSDFALPVAVRDRIETQHYVTDGRQSLSVPAGTFDAVRVSRTGGGEKFEAWFAPGKVPAPVKIDKRGKNDFAIELESWSTQ